MKVCQIQTIDQVIDHAASALTAQLLAGRRVLWLLSGGSAIDLEVRIAQALQTLDASRLSIGLIDERYGPSGHTDENYMQLMNAHFPLFVTRVLRNKSGDKTAKLFGQEIKQALQDADYSLGIFGIGTDGHTAGIKPGSPALTSTEPAIFYKWDDHERITLTPQIIHQLDEAIIYAVGSEKSETLQTLLENDTLPSDQPAQLLKKVKTVTLYTDVAF